MQARTKGTHIAARRLGAFLGAVAMLLGAVGFTGWLFDLPLLRTVISGYASMKANTAVGLLAAGLALILAAAFPASAGVALRLRQAAAATAILLGASALAQFFGRIDLGIDQFLFRDPFTPVEMFSGRMARADAVGFLLFGFSVLFSLRQPAWAFWLGFTLTAAGFWGSLFVCMGFMFNVQALYGSSWFGSVAIHTALGFLALFAGMMLAVPNRGWARIVLTDKVGGVVARRVLPLIAAVPLGILWLAHKGEEIGLYGERVSEYVAAVALLIVLTTLAIVMCGRLNVIDAHRRLMEDGRQRAQAEAVLMRHMAEIDSLTELWNRRHFLAEAEQQIAAAQADGTPLALLMIDIDHFKRINDTYGHASGDTALRLLAATLKDFTRKDDCVARLGGEEFAVLLPGAARTVARGIAERFREQVARLVILDGEGRRFSFTVSVGLGEVQAADAKPEDLMARADAALYAAKRGGRNRVELAFAPERSAA
jgi:diguanylate cyclase (GGDEF)-like protein